MNASFYVNSQWFTGQLFVFVEWLLAMNTIDDDQEVELLRYV